MRIKNQNYLIVGLYIVSLLICLPGISHGDKKVTEYQIKAVFLYNLAHFTTWPESVKWSDDFFCIGIIGDDPFGEILEKTVAGERVNGKKIRIIRYPDIPAIDSNKCEILFVASTAVQQLRTIKQNIEKSSILIVADTPGSARQGVMVNLVNTNQRIEVEINRREVRSAGLFISSKLLQLAKVVE